MFFFPVLFHAHDIENHNPVTSAAQKDKSYAEAAKKIRGGPYEKADAEDDFFCPLYPIQVSPFNHLPYIINWSRQRGTCREPQDSPTELQTFIIY